MAERDPQSPPQQPLSATWRAWTAGFPDWLAPGPDGDDGGAPEFDAIVVGSGYGGSVAALRLVQKGYRTLLLERGSEYLPGEFPNDFSLVPKSVRINIPTQGVPAGRASGLIELHLGQGLVGVTGNGLGGGSLINAGVAIEPDPDVFVQPEWPADIRHGASQPGLEHFFELARTTLQARPWVSGLPVDGADQPPLLKTQALHRLAPLLAPDARAGTVSLTIDPDHCIRCGDCAAGCNVPGAKKTLASTYLQRAIDEPAGRLQIVTQAEVYRCYPAAPAAGAGSDAQWSVEVFATEVQHQYLATRELLGDRSPASTVRRLSAPLLFICAGTFGSTQLLQRSQALAGRAALSLSPALGTRLSGNGDSISVSTAEPEPVNSVGRGGIAAAAYAARLAAGIVGPTITAMIDLRDRKLPLDRRLLIQDGAVPRTIARLYHELLATSWTLKQLGNWWFDPPPVTGTGYGDDPLAASPTLAQHTQLLLAMGHDGSPARMVWLDCYDRSAPFLADAQELVTYQEQQRLWDALGRRHVHNPLWRALPESVMGVLSGPKPPHTVTTVHPLGGCVMGDAPESSVVNHLGQVWVHDPGSQRNASPKRLEPALTEGYLNAPRTYRGLYVIDGSIVPTALGCNPLLTITALAERILDSLPHRDPASPGLRGVLRSGQRLPQVVPSTDVRIGAELNETLMAENALALRGSLAQCLGATRTSARLSVVFESDDLATAMLGAHHDLPPEALLALADGASHSNAAMLVYRSQAGDPMARFEALPANWTSAGPWLLIGAVLQTLALVALGVLAIGLFVAPLLTLPMSLLEWILLPIGMAGGLLLGGLALIAALVALPFGRTALTWLALRGWKDIRDRDRSLPWGEVARLAVDAYRQLVHASETRTMVYRIPMTLDLAQSAPDSRVQIAPRSITLHARKTVSFRAGVGQVLRWFWGLVRKGWRRGCLAPMRETIWEQVMDAQVKLVANLGGPSAASLAAGRFRMGLDNLLSPGRLDGRNPLMPAAMQLGSTGDSTTGLLALASYPMLYLRFALKTRLFDFRLPNYSNLPVRDDAPPAQVTLRSVRDGPPDVVPEWHWLEVPRGISSNDQADESQQKLRLRLGRYRRRNAAGQPGPPVVDLEASWRGIPVARARSVLLLHAFGQSGLSFTFQQTEQNLAEAFWQQGYEVWILEMRMSTRSGQADHPSTVDMIAQHDIPVAVAAILKSIAQEPGLELGARKLQICAFAQCIGSAALWMSLLDGQLCHGPADVAAEGAGEGGRCLSMLSHAVFSQVHPWVVGSRGSQAKTWVPAILGGLLRQQAVPFAVRGPQTGWLGAGMDRLFASMPVPPLENREVQGKDDAAATCKRIRFVEAPLFEQAHLNDDTFAAMNLLFGDANLRLFSHARRFVENERLVDEDANNRYVTDANIRKHLDFPIQLLHGFRNRLFDVSSARHSFNLLGGIHGGWQNGFCRLPGAAAAAPLIINGYGHLDVLIGARADRHVYPKVLSFMTRCQGQQAHTNAVASEVGWVLRGAKVGPLLGWIRQEPAGVVVRFSFVLDEYDGVRSGADVLPIIVRYRTRASGSFISLPGWRIGFAPIELKTYAIPTASTKQQPVWPAHPRCAAQAEAVVARRAVWVDVLVKGADPTGFELQVFSVHQVSHPAQPDALATPTPDDREIDGFLTGPGPVGKGQVVRPPVSLPHRRAAGTVLLKISAAALQALTPADQVTFAASCCRFPGLALDLERIDHSVSDFMREHGHRAAFALLLGDQIYADATAGLIDPISPLERFYERHETAFSSVMMRRFLASVPTCMTPDDHEWTDGFPDGRPLVMEHWPDWTPRSAFARRQRAALQVAASAVTGYQRLHSEAASRSRRRYDVFTSGCVRVFVINSRSARSRGRAKIVSRRVLNALHRWLLQGRAQTELLSVVATGSVLVPGLRPDADPASPGPADNWQLAPRQRTYVLGMLNDLLPGRFLLLSGDYHVSAAVEIRGSDGAVHGAAIVAPPLYAPLPYANARTEALAIDETIELRHDTLQIGAVVGGESQRGSGVGRITVSRQAGGFEIRYDRDLWVWEAGEASRHSAVIALP